MLRGGNVARWALRLLVSGAIVVYILVDVDLGDLGRALASVRLVPLCWSTVLFLAGQILSAHKWQLIGNRLGFSRPFRDYVRFYFVGMFFNLFGLSTLGGDLVRGLYLSDGRRPALALNSVLFDRVSGLVLLVALGALGLVLFPGYGFPRAITLGMLAAGVALAGGLWLAPHLVGLLPTHRWTHQLKSLVGADLAPLWRDGPGLAHIAAVSVAFHLLQVAVQWELGHAAGASLPFSYCLIFHPIISVMTALPVSVNGFGVREGGYLYFLTRLDVDDSIAVTVSLLWFGLTLVGGILGGLVFLASGATLPALRRPPSERSAA
jgi:hypothetical protein